MGPAALTGRAAEPSIPRIVKTRSRGGGRAELRRMLKPGGAVAFKAGEVRSGKVLLEHAAVRAGLAAGLAPPAVMINQQEFTITAKCRGVDNNANGTNTNRIVIFTKE